MAQTRVLFICHGNSDEIRGIVCPDAPGGRQNAAAK